MMIKTLTILIPVFNEASTIDRLLTAVCAAKLPDNIGKEIIVIDDCSTDGTIGIIEGFIAQRQPDSIRLVKHSQNKGKGAALWSGIRLASGDCIIIQDADLEYDPDEYPILLDPVIEGKADVVYGSRFMGARPHRVLFFWHYIGNKFLTLLSNMFTNLNLTDMETCYKLFKTDVLQGLDLKEKRFGFEPEVTAKIARIAGLRIYEVGISYYGRTYEEGKKINWRDGMRAVYCILKYGLLRQ